MNLLKLIAIKKNIKNIKNKKNMKNIKLMIIMIIKEQKNFITNLNLILTKF